MEPLPRSRNQGSALFSIGVVAHTSREPEAKALAHEVEADFISVDNGILGCDDNHEAVQQHLAALTSTWSVILEDDAVPVEDFRAQLTQALPMAPAPIVSLYLGRQRPPHWQKRIQRALAQAEETESPWIISTHMLHAVGYAIRTEHLPSLLAHESTHPIDEHISSWARRYGHTIAYTTPSLVDHADWPTIVDHPDGDRRKPGRTAWSFGSTHQWTTKTVTL